MTTVQRLDTARSSQEEKQRYCSAFLAGLEALKRQLPEDFFTAERPQLLKSFLALDFKLKLHHEVHAMFFTQVALRFCLLGLWQDAWIPSCKAWYQAQSRPFKWRRSASFDLCCSSTNGRWSMIDARHAVGTKHDSLFLISFIDTQCLFCAGG